jgi:hypothetical protein
MKKIQSLSKKQEILKNSVSQYLNILMGTVAKSPSMSGHCLTKKVKQKTVTVYVRKAIVPQAIEMTKNYAKLKEVLMELSEVNWEILKMENE